MDNKYRYPALMQYQVKKETKVSCLDRHLHKSKRTKTLTKRHNLLNLPYKDWHKTHKVHLTSLTWWLCLNTLAMLISSCVCTGALIASRYLANSLKNNTKQVGFCHKSANVSLKWLSTRKQKRNTKVYLRSSLIDLKVLNTIQHACGTWRNKLNYAISAIMP